MIQRNSLWPKYICLQACPGIFWLLHPKGIFSCPAISTFFCNFNRFNFMGWVCELYAPRTTRYVQRYAPLLAWPGGRIISHTFLRIPQQTCTLYNPLPLPHDTIAKLSFRGRPVYYKKIFRDILATFKFYMIKRNQAQAAIFLVYVSKGRIWQSVFTLPNP